jgi:hypothetical protein
VRLSALSAGYYIDIKNVGVLAWSESKWSEGARTISHSSVDGAAAVAVVVTLAVVVVVVVVVVVNRPLSSKRRPHFQTLKSGKDKSIAVFPN